MKFNPIKIFINLINLYKKEIRKNEFNSRIISVFIFFIFFLGIISLRLIYLNKNNFFYFFNSPNPSFNQRANILDSQKNILAYSEKRYNIYLNAKNNISELDIVNLIEVLGLSRKKIEKIIANKKVVLLKRFAGRHLLSRVLKINRNNILLIDKVKYRYYPYKELLSQTLGFVGHDGNGLAGVELKYNQELNYQQNKNKEKNIILNINKDFQKELEILLKKTIVENNAKSGTIVVQEIFTGRVLALVNYPTFNLNRFKQQNSNIFRNLGISSIIDPGSIFKAIFSAYLIENYNVDVKEKKYFCKGYYELANGEIIRDHAKHGEVSLEDIIKYSCNPGMIQVTEVISNKEMFNFLNSLLIGEKTGVDLPGESSSRIPPLKEWGIRTRATLPLGHGLSLSPLHLSAIFSAFISDGNLRQPQIVQEIQTLQEGKIIDSKKTSPQILSKVLKPETSKKLIDLLVLGTLKGSSGSASRQTGFKEVFGKTGTSQLVNLKSGGYYTNRYDSAFAGGYPSSAPLYSIIIIVNQPQKKYHGGRVAAPLYAKILEKLILHYNLPNERIIEEYNQNFAYNDDSYHSRSVQFLGDIVPNFKKLSLRNSLILINDFKKNTPYKKIDFEIIGNGYVKQQSPPISSKVTNNLKIKILLK